LARITTFGLACLSPSMKGCARASTCSGVVPKLRPCFSISVPTEAASSTGPSRVFTPAAFSAAPTFAPSARSCAGVMLCIALGEGNFTPAYPGTFFMRLTAPPS